MGIFDRLIENRVSAAVRSALAVVENENSFLTGTRSLTQSDRDRYAYDRKDVLEQSLEAWRTNPLARRIVELTSQYVVGGGLTINTKHTAAGAFFSDFWNHRLNHMPVRLAELCDELTRTGNLFVLVSTDPAGMSYIRVLPASEIEEIISKPNDIEQPVSSSSKLPSKKQIRSPSLPTTRSQTMEPDRLFCIMPSTGPQGRSGENQILLPCSNGYRDIPHGSRIAPD